MIVHPVLFAGARTPRGVGHGEHESVGVALKQETVQRTLSDARRPGNDNGFPLWGEARHDSRDGGYGTSEAVQERRC